MQKRNWKWFLKNKVEVLDLIIIIVEIKITIDGINKRMDSTEKMNWLVSELDWETVPKSRRKK